MNIWGRLKPPGWFVFFRILFEMTLGSKRGVLLWKGYGHNSLLTFINQSIIIFFVCFELPYFALFWKGTDLAVVVTIFEVALLLSSITGLLPVYVVVSRHAKLH